MKDLTSDSGAYRALLGNLSAAIAPLQTLHQQAVEALAPSVREIIDSRSRDARLIEHTLDYLLDHACIPQGLAVFKSLCRHYWEINPQATARYINAYREMWDANDQETKEAELAGDLVASKPDSESESPSKAHAKTRRRKAGKKSQ
jgi:hypothetical protein